MRVLLILFILNFATLSSADKIVPTGDLGVVIERASGSVLIVDQSEMDIVARVDGFGDLSHASVVFSPDQRFAFVFGRDGGLTKLDLTTQSIADRVLFRRAMRLAGRFPTMGGWWPFRITSPGGVRVFDAETLEMVADIPTGSKTIGLVDAPGRVGFCFPCGIRARPGLPISRARLWR